MKNILNYIKSRIKYIIASVKYDWSYLGVLNSPFIGLRIEWYWGDISKGVPYFLPRREAKMTKEDCEESLRNDKERCLPRYVENRDWTYYKNHKKFVPIKYFGFNYTTLGWKTKWDDYRFEWAPIYSFVIFGKQLCITVKPKIDSIEDKALIEDIYWEAWLNYRYNTDKTKSKVDRLKELKEKHSCTYVTHSTDKEKDKIETDYYPTILKAKYL